MKRSVLFSAVVTASLMASPVVAEESPYLEPDGSWITLSGTVVNVESDHFTLDYGDGTVRVEMDDWDWYKENSASLSGDEVTVYGEVDDDTYEAAKIEASSVYVEDMGTYFYASAKDEETLEDFDLTPTAPIVVGDLTITGTVTGVNGSEFTVDSGTQKMTVDTANLPYNPLDDEGFQQVDKGDFVTVTGDIDNDTLETQELMADSIITLEDEASG